MRSQYEEGDALLFIGSQDRSADFRGCLDQTKYLPPAPQLDPRAELDEKQAIADAGTRWAKCARDNGFPDVADPKPPLADGWATQPSVKLPFSISEEALMELVAVCPPSNSSAEEGVDDTPGADPVIEFEMEDDPQTRAMSESDIRSRAEILHDIILAGSEP
jgi:hypothetical protein